MIPGSRAYLNLTALMYKYIHMYKIDIKKVVISNILLNVLLNPPLYYDFVR
jgi:hypothetical protein